MTQQEGPGPRLTADDIIDLSRWHFIQFPDSETATLAMKRYERYLERKQQEQQS